MTPPPQATGLSGRCHDMLYTLILSSYSGLLSNHFRKSTGRGRIICLQTAFLSFIYFYGN